MRVFGERGMSGNKSPKTIATINFKGGVGKTTVTWCLADTLKATFPRVARKMQERRDEISGQRNSSLTSEQAQNEFNHIVEMARSGATSEAENYLERQSSPDLLVIAKEIGVTFRNNKPSIKAMREAILGRVRESMLLSRHSRRE
jgi:hypothetical protein